MSTCDGLRGIINGHDFASIRQAHARQFEGDLTRKMEFLIANNGMKNIRQRVTVNITNWKNIFIEHVFNCSQKDRRKW